MVLYFSQDVAKAQSVCALRFKGYEYEHCIDTSITEVTGKGISRLIELVVKELILHQSQNDNFAAFFGLQRFLHK